MNKFTIHYPNGIKRHINRQELTLLSGSLTQTGPHEYSAASLQANLAEANGPAYLPGSFIIELRGQRERERLQTSKGQIQQLEAMGWRAEHWHEPPNLRVASHCRS